MNAHAEVTEEKPPIDKRADQYVKLRDLIADVREKHKKELAPYLETLAQLNAAILQHLNEIGAESVKTKSGTVHKTAKKSATIADMSAFWAYVVATGDWDLLDKKANVTAVDTFIKEKGIPVPGVNFSSHFEVGVRRPRS